jgi:Uma2 family endonuclease
MTFLMHSPLPRLKDSFVPDLSFIRNENIPADWDPKKPHPGVPDFAVEIVSPGDDINTVLKKVRTYLEKGTEQVLILYPNAHEVHQRRRSQPDIDRIYRTGRLDLDDMFEGLELTVEMVFALPAWAQKQANI